MEATYLPCRLAPVLQVVLCGFGSECNIVNIEALSECEPLDTSNTLQLLQQTLQHTAQQAQQAAPPPPALQQHAQQGQQPGGQPPQEDAEQGSQPAQQGEQQGGQPSGNGASSSASGGPSRPSGSGSPVAPDTAPRVAAGGVDGQLTYQMMSERMSDLYNWVVSRASGIQVVGMLGSGCGSGAGWFDDRHKRLACRFTWLPAAKGELPRKEYCRCHPDPASID